MQIYQVPHRSSDYSVGDACADIEACPKMEGLTKCKIVPPKDLYLPDLPYRCDKKLILPVPNMRPRTLRANVDISSMPRDVWKALGS